MAAAFMELALEQVRLLILLALQLERVRFYLRLIVLCRQSLRWITSRSLLGMLSLIRDSRLLILFFFGANCLVISLLIPSLMLGV